jgi:hypothetical protein
MVMGVLQASILAALVALLCACAPEKKCGGELYFDGRSCRLCPDDAKFENHTCVCNEAEFYEFADDRCMLKDGAMPPVEEPEEDSGTTPAAAGCSDYCDFAKVCVADNPIASAALSDVVTGLKADDSKGCQTACETDTGGPGTADPVVACFAAGRSTAGCENEPTQAGFGGAIKLMGSCCKGQSSELCKSICAVLTANALLKNSITFCE